VGPFKALRPFHVEPMGGGDGSTRRKKVNAPGDPEQRAARLFFSLRGGCSYTCGSWDSPFETPDARGELLPRGRLIYAEVARGGPSFFGGGEKVGSGAARFFKDALTARAAKEACSSSAARVHVNRRSG